jgi:anionic cell wall polymer biosynthesis LytR-Cps2A-Psr (LCP) family protein
VAFNGVAVIDFEGFENVVNALGSVHLCVDEEVYSIHYYADGRRAPVDLDRIGKQSQGKHYTVGCRDVLPWEALDYSRQRHMKDGDYGRQRHQQQMLRAVMEKIASTDTLTNLGTMAKLQGAAGDLLTLDLGVSSLEEWAWTLSPMKPDDVVMIKTNGGDFNSDLVNDTWYEYLSADSLALLRSVQTDTVLDFLDAHPDWVVTD